MLNLSYCTILQTVDEHESKLHRSEYDALAMTIHYIICIILPTRDHCAPEYCTLVTKMIQNIEHERQSSLQRKSDVAVGGLEVKRSPGRKRGARRRPLIASAPPPHSASRPSITG